MGSYKNRLVIEEYTDKSFILFVNGKDFCGLNKHEIMLILEVYLEVN